MFHVTKLFSGQCFAPHGLHGIRNNWSTIHGHAEMKCVPAISTGLPEVLKVLGASWRPFCISCSFYCERATESAGNDTIKGIKKQDRSNFIAPILTEHVRKEILNAVSLQITNTVVAWAKMSRDNHLLEWDVIDLPNDKKKGHPSLIYETVLEICGMCPPADLYVMEDMNKSAETSNSAIMTNKYLLQIRAMLLTYFNTCREQDEIDTCGLHKVYFLRSAASARLSSTLVGRERVSTERIVNNLLCASTHATCHQYSPITVDWPLRNMYMSKESVQKEVMGQALLLNMAFMDLVIRRRPESLKFIARS